MGRGCIAVAVGVVTVIVFTGVGVGLGYAVSSNGTQDSNSTESQFTARSQGGLASNPLAIVPVDGFNMTAPAYCHGEGTDISSHVENTLKACSEACVSSLSYRAFQFSPSASKFCTLYDATFAVSSIGLFAACYMQTSPPTPSADEFVLINNVSCGKEAACTLPEVCDGKRCRRVNEEVDVSMQCADLTDQFTEPDVPEIGEETIIAAALAASPNQQPIRVRQGDFSRGVFEITQSGYYKLVEDITIPWINENLNIESPGHLGQTVGIRVTGVDIVLDLNGHTVQLHEDTVRFEPFMNIIQLGNNNFPEGVFGFSKLVSANRVVVFSSVEKKGTLRLSTHFGISGIQNKDVIIRNLRIEDNSIGGISLTDGKNIHIEDVVINNAKLRNLWTPFFNAVVQLRRRLYQIVQRVTADATTSPLSLDTWKSMRDIVERRVVNARWALNPTPDRILGNAFGIQVKNMVHGKANGGENIKITNAKISDIKIGRSEVVAVRDSDDVVLMDADGSVFEWDHFFFNDGGQKFCVSNDDRCVTVQQINDIRLIASTYLCSQNVPGISCIEGLASKLTAGGSATLRPFPGADIRGHVPKGVFGVRFVGITDGIVDNVEIHDIDNAESPASDVDAVQNHYESPILWRGREQAKNVFKGHMSFGFYGERCTSVKLDAVSALRVKSEWGSTIAVGFGDQSRHIVLREVSAHVEKPRESTETVKIPNVVPYGMPFYAEEDVLSCMRVVDITSLGEFRTGEKHRNVIAVAPVVDCETNPTGSRFCASIGTQSPGPTQCSSALNAGATCGNTPDVPVNNTCESVDSSIGLGKAMCCDGAYRSYSSNKRRVTCHSARNGICRCPSDRPYMCPSGSGQRWCAVSKKSCSVIVGQSCPKMNRYTVSSPNCPCSEMGPTTADVVLTCRDGTTCLAVDGGRRNWGCCKNRGGRWKCPRQWPFMCAEVSRRCGNEHCCSSTVALCESRYSGLLEDTEKSGTICPLPLTTMSCKRDNQCKIPGQTCDKRSGRCMGYLSCSAKNYKGAKDNRITQCMDRRTCKHNRRGSSTCCRALRPRSFAHRCPASRPYMCKDTSCKGDHCCMRSGSQCAYKGGVIDVCPKVQKVPSTCHGYKCPRSQYLQNPDHQCASSTCTRPECCVPKPTCATANVVCPASSTRRHKRVCGKNCTQDKCCKHYRTCKDYSCSAGYARSASHSRKRCANGKCSDRQCCVPQCNSAYPTDASCSAQVRHTIVHPDRMLHLCSGKKCTHAQCCADTCDTVKCARSNYHTNKPGRPTGYCGPQGCTMDTCCSLTCASHTCSAKGMDVPGELTGTVCANGVCDDTQCGCRMKCPVYWETNGCNENFVRNRAKENTLCRSPSQCNNDCCVQEYRSVGDLDESTNDGAVAVGSIALIACFALLGCFVAAFLTMRLYKDVPAKELSLAQDISDTPKPEVDSESVSASRSIRGAGKKQLAME